MVRQKRRSKGKGKVAASMIPITRPYIGKKEEIAVSQVLRSGWLTQGPKVRQFEDIFAAYVGAKYACAVSSCTTALHLALIAVGVKPGDVVITVSHSFIATANSIRYCQAEPVFADIDPDTFNMSVVCLDEILNDDCQMRNGQLYYKKVSDIVTGASFLRNFSCKDKMRVGRVAAILPVHQMGMPCDLKEILRLASKFKLPVVEDAACAIGSEIKINSGWEKIGKPHGDIACFSFHPRKIITAGEGGMLTTNNPRYHKLFRLLRHHGMTTSDRERHNASKVIFEKYITLGYNYRLTDIQAVISIEQMKKLPAIINERRKIAGIYRRELEDVPWLELPKEPAYCKSNWQSYAVRVKNNANLSRDRLMQHLLDAGISTRRGIMNAHQELPYKFSKWNLPVSEKARDNSMLLPIFNSLSISQLKYISRMLHKIKK